MSKNKSPSNSDERDALDRMKTEASGAVLGYKASNTAQGAGAPMNKMMARGEIEAENLGNATMENEYNSSK
jgi:hypothetical protein